MEVFSFLFFALIFYFFVKIISNIQLPKKNEPKAPVIDIIYHYNKKSYIMTRRENDFFKRLDHIFGKKFYIFPQAHLDAILDHKVKKQNWKAALSKIQRKSLDYTFYDKQTMTLKFAIELDDLSHDRPSRQKRDREVESILDQADIKLIRFRHDSLTDQQIVDRIAHEFKN